jgi:iron complex outermembrane receptor protein
MRVASIFRNVSGGVSLIALAIGAPAMAQAPDDSEAEAIVVFGKGETRQVQEVDALDIQLLTPGASPIKAIEKLPSVNVQASDPFGNYEWSTRVTIRSFAQSQLGFNLDGIPLGDMQYGNHNGLHVSRAISSENLGSVRVSQGAGAIGSQATNNLGGTLEYASMEPLDHFAVDMHGTYGSNETMRGFVRVNMGSADGLRGYISYAYGSTDKYKGEGTQDQHMVNAKAVMPLGEGQIDAWFSWSDRREQDYQDMSLDMLARLGYEFDNTFPDYARAVLYADIGINRGETGAAVSNAAAGTAYPGNVATVDDAYYDASGLRKDTLAALGYETPLGDNARIAIKGYYHHNEGMGLWATPYVPSPAGVPVGNGSGLSAGSPISTRTTEYDIDRYGLFGSANFEIGFNKLTVGGWYEHNKFNQARRFYAMASRTEPGIDYRRYPTNPFLTQWEFDFTTKTLQYYVQDTIDLDPVKISVGWKGFRVTNRAEAIIRASFPEGRFKTEDWFQPHVGAVFALSGNAEVFASFTQATRSFPSVNGSIWGTTQAGFDAIKDTIKPETSDTYELGARYSTGSFNGLLGVYLVNFNDRLLGVASGPDIIGSPSVLQNVGSVRSIGVEAAGDWKFATNWSLFASYTYTDATYRDDVVDGKGVVTALKGKTVVDAPKHMIKGALNYDNGSAYANFSLNYMSKRYFNYLNDRSVDGRLIADFTLGYRLEENLEFQFNVSNLFDEQYIGTVNSAGTGNSGDRQTLLVGAPQQAFITLKAGF